MDIIEDVLSKYKKIAVVGMSDNPARDSLKIARYMHKQGYTVYGVNPKLDGKVVDGMKCYSVLKDIPDTIEIVDIFRRPDAVVGVVEEVLKLDYKVPVIWTQIGVGNPEAQRIAEDNGIIYIDNRCLYIEHSNL
ncbi:MAG TPA: CoA-binding protein [Ignavibacteria bacterium]|nr:CoA-binding protein [Ignavibacteria bacterium]